MNLDEKKLSRIVKCLSNKTQRKIMHLLEGDKALRFSELKLLITKNPSSSGIFAYNVKVMKDLGIISRDNNGYFLTRVGVQLLKLLESFEKICSSYDISDCDKDGKIVMSVRDRQL